MTTVFSLRNLMITVMTTVCFLGNLMIIVILATNSQSKSAWTILGSLWRGGLSLLASSSRELYNDTRGEP